jgi:hypothetical protein
LLYFQLSKNAAGSENDILSRHDKQMLSLDYHSRFLSGYFEADGFAFLVGRLDGLFVLGFKVGHMVG